jgi:hypothetical protein
VAFSDAEAVGARAARNEIAARATTGKDTRGVGSRMSEKKARYNGAPPSGVDSRVASRPSTTRNGAARTISSGKVERGRTTDRPFEDPQAGT